MSKTASARQDDLFMLRCRHARSAKYFCRQYALFYQRYYDDYRHARVAAIYSEQTQIFGYDMLA